MEFASRQFFTQTLIRASVVVLLLALAGGGWSEDLLSGASVSLEIALFTAGAGRSDGPPPATPPTGRPGSALNSETLAGDNACDDIFQGLFHPAGYSNVKVVDDGGANWGTAPHPGVPNAMSLTISSEGENVDALALYTLAYPTPVIEYYADSRAMLVGGSLFIQFSVDPTGDGDLISGFVVQSPAIPDVTSQATVGVGTMEYVGDIYEAVFGAYGGSAWAGSNVSICDEDALGLLPRVLPAGVFDDTDGIILQSDLASAPLFFDTDGGSGLDTPMIYFSLENPVGEIEKGTGNPISGADILLPSDNGPPVSVVFSAAALGLTAADDIDALYVTPSLDTTIIFSLDRDSPSLMTIANPIVGGVGADPGDLIHVRPFAMPPVPRVWALASELGIDGDNAWLGPGSGPGASIDDDDLNALWITAHSLIDETVPVELSVFRAE